MKNILLAIAVVFVCGSFKISSDELKWLDWNTGYPLGQKTGKIILVDAYTDWCGWCKKMDRDTYTNQKIISILNKDFIIIKFNPEIKDVTYDLDGQKVSGRELFTQLTQGKSTGFPTTYFIEPNKKQIQIAAGYLGPEDFLKVLEQIKQILK
jgi:thioredoxin-related protein